MSSEEDEDDFNPNAPIKCWCGAEGTFEELFDQSVYLDTCGGTGFLDCVCGGDFCICHHHGETECFGCVDCNDDQERDDDDGADGY